MLPNPLHPAIVHFPIVLGVLAPVAAFGVLLAWRRARGGRGLWAIPAGLLAALTLSAWLAIQTGEREEDRVEKVVGEAPLETHEEAAEVFLWVAGAVALLSLAGFVRGLPGTVGRGVTAAGTLVVLGAGYQVGRSGGALVYEHGAAQAYAPGAGTGGGEGNRQVRPKSRDDDEAMLQLDEARRHYAQILPLLRNLHNGDAANELLAAAVHVEQAQVALGGRGSPSVAAARSAAEVLRAQPAGVPAPVVDAMRRLEAELMNQPRS